MELANILTEKEQKTRKIWPWTYLFSLIVNSASTFLSSSDAPSPLFVFICSLFFAFLPFYFSYKRHGTKLLRLMIVLTAFSFFFFALFALLFAAFFFMKHSGIPKLEVLAFPIQDMDNVPLVIVKDLLSILCSLPFFLFSRKLLKINQKIHAYKLVQL